MAGSVSHTYSYARKRGGLNKVVSSWTSDSGGDVNGLAKISINGLIHRIVTNPSSTAPTDNYDIVLNDEDGLDVAQGLLANRDTANSESVTPMTGNGTLTDKLVAVAGTLDLVISAAGASKAGAVTIYWR